MALSNAPSEAPPVADVSMEDVHENNAADMSEIEPAKV